MSCGRHPESPKVRGRRGKLVCAKCSAEQSEREREKRSGRIRDAKRKSGHLKPSARQNALLARLRKLGGAEWLESLMWRDGFGRQVILSAERDRLVVVQQEYAERRVVRILAAGQAQASPRGEHE